MSHDPPPEEPASRVSVVRQLEEDDEEDAEMMMAPVAAVAATRSTGKKPSFSSAPIEPSGADMDGMPGDEDDLDASVAVPAPVPPAATKVARSAKAPAKASSKPPTPATAKPLKPSSSKPTTKPPSVQATPRAPVNDRVDGDDEPPAQIHAVILDRNLRPPSAALLQPTPVDNEPSESETKEEEEEAPVVVAPKVKKLATKSSIKKPPTVAPSPPPAADTPPPAAAASAPPKAAPAKVKKVSAPVAKPSPPPASVTPPPPAFVENSELSAAFLETHQTMSALTDANRSLTAMLAQRNTENAQMADALLCLEEELAVAEQGGGVSLSKDLARKNREAALLLNKERSQHAQALDALKKQHAATLEELRLNGGALPKPTHSPKKSVTAFGGTAPIVAQVAAPASVDALEAKLASSQRAYLEKSNECSQLTAKLKQMARVLVKEIDESLKPEEVCEERFLGRVKGRAQKIARLNDRVRELEKALASGGGSATTLGGFATNRSSAAPTPDGFRDQSTPGSSSGVQDFHENTLQKMQSDRRNDLANLREAFDAKQLELDTQKRKFDAMKARNKILEGELKSLREKATVLFEKSAADDVLIDELHQHVASSKRALQEKEKEWKMGQDPNAASARRPPSGSTPASLARQNAEIKAAEQEKTINSLREEVRRLGGKTRKAEATPEQSARMNAYVRAEFDTQVELQRVENDKWRTMVSHQSARIGELEPALLAAQKRIAELEAQRSVTLAQSSKASSSSSSQHSSVGHGFGGGAPRSSVRAQQSSAASSSASASSSSGDVSSLRSQLASALSEQQLIQNSYSHTLAAKEQDIAILNEILNQKNQLYLSNIADLRAKFQAVTAALQ